MKYENFVGAAPISLVSKSLRSCRDLKIESCLHHNKTPPHRLRLNEILKAEAFFLISSCN